MKINEITRIERYYRDNPDRLPQYNLSPPKSKSDDPRYSAEEYYQKKKDAETAFEKKWRGIFGRELSKKLFSYGSDVSYYVERAIQFAAGDVNKFISKYEELAGALEDQEKKIIALHYIDFVRSIKKLEKYVDGVSRAVGARATKQATKSNLSREDYEAVQAWIEHYTSMSRKTIPPEIWPALQRLTVIPARLPKTVYRGLFFDGAKIKDREKWLKQWAPGSKPNAKPTKIQSWSTSIGVASQFMDAQDFVKDRKNGFAVMLKYDITDPGVVIADMRKLKDSGYWNQQEIILSPAARDYEVVAVIPNEDYDGVKTKWTDTELYKYRSKHEAPAASAWGSDRTTTFVNNMFDVNLMQIDTAEKEEMKQATKLTVGQAKKKFGFRGRFIDSIEQTFDNTLLPLYGIVSNPNSNIDNKWNILVDRAVDQNTVNAYIVFDPSYSLDKRDTVFRKVFADGASYYEKLYLPVNITLSNNEYNAMRFEITPTGDFFVGSGRAADDGIKPSTEKIGAGANQRLQSSSSLRRELMTNLQSALASYPKKNVKFALSQ